MKLAALKESLKEDIKTVFKFYGVDIKSYSAEHRTLLMHRALTAVSYDRAYDDTHPAFVAGRKRILPYDGRDYCFYYVDGANDTHVETLLKAILKDLLS